MGLGAQSAAPFARAFAREGARLFLTGPNVAKVDALARDIAAAGGVAETAQVDALDEKAVEAHLSTVVESGTGRHLVQRHRPGPDARPRTPDGAGRRRLRPPDRLLHQLQLHHGDRRRPAHERPGLGCDRHTDGRSRPDAGQPPRRERTGLGCGRGVLAFPGPRGGTSRHPGGLPASPCDPGDPAHQGELRHGGPGRRCQRRRVPGDPRTGHPAQAAPTLDEVAGHRRLHRLRPRRCHDRDRRQPQRRQHHRLDHIPARPGGRCASCPRDDP